MENLVRLPYQIVSPKVIKRLVEDGYLRRAQRHDTDAVLNALGKLRSRPTDIFGRPEEDNEPTPAA